MAHLPIMFRVDGRRCIVIGGGSVAVRRVRTLLDLGANVTVIAPELDGALQGLNITVYQRRFEPGDLDGATFAIAATDDPQVNAQISEAAAPRGVLVNRADAPELGDFVIPAHTQQGPLTVAVSTGGVSAGAAARIRDQLLEDFDTDWPRLLDLVAPFRQMIRQRFADPAERRRRLRQLADEDMLQRLKNQGPQAVLDYCGQLADTPDAPPAAS